MTNSQALDRYREGWEKGDTEMILSIVDKSSFTFTWLPDNKVVSTEEFPQYFENFMKTTGADTNMITFENIIHKEIEDALYEAADWIIEGYGRGLYFNTARAGLVSWDMATKSQSTEN